MSHQGAQSCYLFVKPWEVRRVPGNHRLGGGDAEKVEKVRKMTREAEREEGKEKRSLQKMEEDHWRCCDETGCKTLGRNWSLGDHVDDDDGHAEEHDEDDCDVDGGGAMMRSV